MAKRDIAGLLTGIPSVGIDPRVGMTGRQMLVQSALAGQQRMAGGLRGMFGGQAPIQQQLALAAAKKEREQQEALANLDLSNPEDLMTLAKIQQTSGDLKGAVSTLNTAKQISQQEGLKKGLLDIARAQGDDEMIAFIEAGGDLKTASTKLLADKTVTGISALTEKEKEEYEDYFDVISDEDLEKAGISTGIFSVFTRDKGVKNRLMYQAEQIYTNKIKQNIPITRQEALLEAMGLLSSSSPDTTVPTSGPTPRGKQKDSFAGTPIKG